MTPTAIPGERFHAPPMPMPTERFSDRDGRFDRVRDAAGQLHDALHDVPPEERGAAIEAMKDTGSGRSRTSPESFSAGREALNDRVNAYLTEHPEASMDEALASVDAFAATPTTDSRGHEVRRVGAPEGDREAQSAALDRYMAAHPGASISEAIAAVERGDA